MYCTYAGLQGLQTAWCSPLCQVLDFTCHNCTCETCTTVWNLMRTVGLFQFMRFVCNLPRIMCLFDFGRNYAKNYASNPSGPIPNDKLLLAPPIFFCATFDAKLNEGMRAILEFYYKRHGEITYLVTQECQIAWITVHEISESLSPSALVTRLERPLVWK